MAHVSVLLKESIDGLALEGGDVFVDGTLGSAGHSAEVARRFGNEVKIIGLDRDPEALKRSEQVLMPLSGSVYLREASFRHVDEVLRNLGVQSAHAILLDLGISSDQIDESGRGFTFQKDEPLLMTMSGRSEGVTAKEILNTWDEETIELILRGFGEEKYSRRIAAKIVRHRDIKPFLTTFELVDAVRAATPSAYSRGRINPATRTFQALRIAVNEELAALEEGLKKCFDSLETGGRLAVISFHSLEDRIVKNFFRSLVSEDKALAVTKKPIVPTEEEENANSRSRSAKLRIIEKK